MARTTTPKSTGRTSATATAPKAPAAAKSATASGSSPGAAPSTGAKPKTSPTPVSEGTKTATSAPPSTARARAADAAAKPDLTVVEKSVPTVSSPELKKRELVDLVAARSGIKKRDVKPVVEAMMLVLGDAIGEGRDINLQPLGKIKVTRIKNANNGKVLTARIRQSSNSVEELNAVSAELKESLAEDDD